MPLKKNPPKDAEKRILALSAGGSSKNGIALHLGVHHETMNRWFEEDPRL